MFKKVRRGKVPRTPPGGRFWSPFFVSPLPTSNVTANNEAGPDLHGPALRSRCYSAVGAAIPQAVFIPTGATPSSAPVYAAFSSGLVCQGRPPHKKEKFFSRDKEGRKNFSPNRAKTFSARAHRENNFYFFRVPALTNASRPAAWEPIADGVAPVGMNNRQRGFSRPRQATLQFSIASGVHQQG